MRKIFIPIGIAVWFILVLGILCTSFQVRIKSDPPAITFETEAENTEPTKIVSLQQEFIQDASTSECGGEPTEVYADQNCVLFYEKTEMGTEPIETIDVGTAITPQQEKLLSEIEWDVTEAYQEPTESYTDHNTAPDAADATWPPSCEETEITTESVAIDANTQPQVDSAAGMDAHTLTADGMGIRRYWLYTPSNATENLPLIVYLHGGSGKGDDLNQIISADGFPQYLHSGLLGDVRAYVLIPQLPEKQRGWTDVKDSLYRLIQSVVSEKHIHADNISLTGHSMGGTGTWGIASAFPSMFSRIAPLSGSIRKPANAAFDLKNIPIWAFVGGQDSIVPPDSSIETVKLLVNMGSDARITVLDEADHFEVPSLVYLDKSLDLIGWLIGNCP